MEILDFFNLDPAPRHLEELETPVPIIDLDVVDHNLKRWQKRCDLLGIANRPHIKTHKLVGLAKYQLALGAKGITVQKLGEAEAMAKGGITDMLLTFNIVGAAKLKRLAHLVRTVDLTVVADNPVVVEGLGQAGQAAKREISVLVECDTGGGRNGVQSPQAAADLAKNIDATPGVSYGGLMTYPRPGSRAKAAAFLGEARDLITKIGLDTKVISTGGTPDMLIDDGLTDVTEYRAGTYIYFDRSQVERGICEWSDCALTVLSTIVSRPTTDRALIDAGSKALTSDLLGLKGYGVVPALQGAQIYELSEEHGFLDISGLAHKPSVGDVVRVLPNHVCPVTNLFNRVVLIRGETVLGSLSVDARGTVQ